MIFTSKHKSPYTYAFIINGIKPLFTDILISRYT